MKKYVFFSLFLFVSIQSSYSYSWDENDKSFKCNFSIQGPDFLAINKDILNDTTMEVIRNFINEYEKYNKELEKIAKNKEEYNNQNSLYKEKKPIPLCCDDRFTKIYTNPVKS